VRAQAVRALARAKESEKIVPAVVEAVGDPDSDVRGNAIAGLGAFGNAAEAAVPAIAETLQGDASIAARSAEALGRIGKPAAAAIPALTEATGHESAEVRSAAIGALSRVTANRVDLVPLLK